MLIGYRSRNHPQQTRRRGPNDEVDDRATHPEFFAPIAARFDFTLDAAAAPHNTKCERFYTREDDGLEQSWAGERVWCNPPFSDIGSWVRKARLEVEAELVVMLLPANRTEQQWWQRYVEPYRDRGGVLTTEFLPGRLRFIKRGQTEVGPNERPPFGCVLLIWDRRDRRD